MTSSRRTIVKTRTIFIAAALALAGTAGAVTAQSSYSRSYNSGAFWQGAPDGLQQRIDWLQQRIDRGVSDGSLDRREARQAQLQLNDLRRQADILNQRLN